MPRGRALVVEPDEGTRRLMAMVLRREGFETREATDAKGAVAHLIDDSRFDLVVLDLGGPDSAISIADFLRENVLTGLRRVIALTSSHDVAASLASDICHALVKPFDLSVFIETARKCGVAPRRAEADREEARA